MEEMLKESFQKLLKKNNRKEKGYNWRKHLKGEKTEVKNEQQEKNVVCNEICDNVEIKQDHPKLDQNIDQLEDKSEKLNIESNEKKENDTDGFVIIDKFRRRLEGNCGDCEERKNKQNEKTWI